VEFGVVVPSYGPWADPGMVCAAIEATEALGFASAWFGDHVVIPSYAAHLSAPRWLDPLACALVGLGATRRLRFGTDVLVLPYRNPVVLSQLLAGADQLSGGRLTVGVGVGYVSGEFAALGTPAYAERGAVTDEYLDALRALWQTPGPVSFTGKWLGFDDVFAEPKPLQTPLPVWVGGNRAAGRRRAALRGDGWHPLFPTPEHYAAGRAEILAARAARRATGPFTFSYSCPECRVYLDSEPEQAAPTYTDATGVPDEYRYAPPPPQAPNGRLRFRGTPEEFRSDVAAFADAGVEHLVLRFWSWDPNVGVDGFVEQLERFQTLVVHDA